MQQRSPIIFWLLLAATISLDLVVSSWIKLFGTSEHLEMVILALVFGQLSAICIWIVFSARPGLYRWLIAGAGLLVAAMAIFRADSSLQISESAALVVTHFMAILIALWLYKLIAARRSRMAADVQFSIKDLFGLTTAIAVLAALLGSATVVQRAWAFTLILMLNNVTIAVTATIAWKRNRHWMWCLAATLAVAIIAGWCVSFARPDLSGDLEVLNSLQVLMILAWLELGEIIPRRGGSDRADAEIASAST